MQRRHKLNSLLAGSIGLAATLIIAFVIAVILMFLLSAMWWVPSIATPPPSP